MSNAKKWKIGFLIAGILIFAYMVYAIGLDNIWDNIRKTGWWFLPIVLVWLVVYIINTFIVRDRRHTGIRYPSFLKMLRWTISGYTINYITPVVALGGEPYRVLELQDYVGARRATSAVLSYSMMHILSHIVFWICSIVLIVVYLQPAWGLTVGLAVTFFIFTGALYMLFRGYRKGLVAKTFRVLEKIPFINKPVRKFSENRMQTFQEIDENIVHLYTARRRVFFKALGLEFLARVVSCLELVFIAKAIGMDMGMLDAIVLYAGSTLFANIMFFSPMQLGTREGGLALTLEIMGFSAALGVYTGLVMRVRELCWIGLGLLLMRIEKNEQRQRNTD